MAIENDIEIILLRSIVERKETCRQAAEILAIEVPKLMAEVRKSEQEACRKEGHKFEKIDSWGSVEVCQKCGVMVS